jgi:hypothetical protein
VSAWDGLRHVVPAVTSAAATAATSAAATAASATAAAAVPVAASGGTGLEVCEMKISCYASGIICQFSVANCAWPSCSRVRHCIARRMRVDALFIGP